MLVRVSSHNPIPRPKQRKRASTPELQAAVRLFEVMGRFFPRADGVSIAPGTQTSMRHNYTDVYEAHTLRKNGHSSVQLKSSRPAYSG